MTKYRDATIILVSAFLALTFLSPTILATTLGDDGWPGTAVVDVKPLFYSPSQLFIKPGTTVIWRNTDTGGHQIVLDGTISDFLDQGDTWSYTFDEKGIYEYKDAHNLLVKGMIVVQ